MSYKQSHTGSMIPVEVHKNLSGEAGDLVKRAVGLFAVCQQAEDCEGIAIGMEEALEMNAEVLYAELDQFCERLNEVRRQPSIFHQSSAAA